MKSKAFTLIELLVVIAIVAIMAALISRTVTTVRSKATPTATARASSDSPVPSMPSTYVTDLAGVLSEQTRHALNEQCARWDNTNGGQLLVYIGTTLPDNEDIESYSQKLFRQWKPGEKGNNRGALFAVFTKSRKMRIHTGYGLEAQLTDADCKRILDEKVKPRLKVNDWDAGIYMGVNEIITQATQH